MKRSSNMAENTRDTIVFQKIYAATYAKLFHFLHRLTAKDDALTDDLLQNVYIDLWQGITEIREGNDCLPLLYTIAKRQLVDHCRKMLAEQRKLSGWKELQPAEGIDTTTDLLDSKEIIEEIENTLSAMPERRRQIFLLRKEEGLSYREIADRLNMSARAVEQQISLALKSLQKNLRHRQYGEITLLLLAATIA